MHKPTTRHILIRLARLLRQRPWTVRELATELNCDAKTIRRNVGLLAALGLGVEEAIGDHGAALWSIYAPPRRARTAIEKGTD